MSAKSTYNKILTGFLVIMGIILVGIAGYAIYDFISAKKINNESEEEYNEFVKNAKNASLYPIDATASYGDQLITLSTCSYYVEDGRFVVVGRKIEQDSK